MMSLFGLPFVAGSMLFWGISLMTQAGKVEVQMRNRRGAVFIGVGPWGRRHPFDLAEVDAIVEESTSLQYPGPPRKEIVRIGRPRLAFGSNLTEARRHFILRTLRSIYYDRQ